MFKIMKKLVLILTFSVLNFCCFSQNLKLLLHHDLLYEHCVNIFNSNIPQQYVPYKHIISNINDIMDYATQNENICVMVRANPRIEGSFLSLSIENEDIDECLLESLLRRDYCNDIDEQYKYNIEIEEGIEIENEKGIEIENEKGIEIENEKGIEIENEEGIEIENEKGIEIENEKVIEIENEKVIAIEIEEGIEEYIVEYILENGLLSHKKYKNYSILIYTDDKKYFALTMLLFNLTK